MLIKKSPMTFKQLSCALFQTSVSTLVCVGMFVCGSASAAESRTFTTPSYDILISYDCPESNRVCNNVTFTSNNKTSGVIEVLRGKKLLPQKNTAKTSTLRYVYRFNAPNKQSRVITHDGQFLKLKDDKVVFQEKGHWNK